MSLLLWRAKKCS